ncbi:MAG: hypothetical protein M3Y87_07650 [Myxococcota bacterium]|nr:hypothetical protein [Myxococcota bacterium]
MRHSPVHHVALEGSVGVLEAHLRDDRVYGALRLFGGGRLYRSSAENEAAVFDLEVSWRGYFGERYAPDGAIRCCVVGNPSVYGMVGWTNGPQLQVRGGIGIAPPLSALTYGIGFTHVAYVGRAQWGFWDSWEGIVGALGVVARGDLEVREGIFLAGAELAFAGSFLVDVGSRDPIAHYQVGGYVGIAPIEWLALGVRVQVAGWSDGGGDPDVWTAPADAQVAVMPFARFFPRPAFFEVAGTMNIDEPLGFASSTLLWAIRVSGGVEWTQ